MKKIILHTLCLPADLFGLLIAAVVTLGSRPRWVRRGYFLTVRPDLTSKFAKKWRFSTTLGHVVVWHPLHGPRDLAHELVHVDQFEAACVTMWLLVGLSLIAPLWGLLPASWFLIYGGASIAAWLRGRETYRGNVFEQHAYGEVRP